MDFSQMLVNVMEFIYQTLFIPIYEFVDFDYLGFDSEFDLSGLFGIKSIPIFSLNDLVFYIIGIAVSITALILFIKFMRFLVGFIRSLFSGVKK